MLRWHFPDTCWIAWAADARDACWCLTSIDGSGGLPWQYQTYRLGSHLTIQMQPAYSVSLPTPNPPAAHQPWKSQASTPRRPHLQGLRSCATLPRGGKVRYYEDR